MSGRRKATGQPTDLVETGWGPVERWPGDSPGKQVSIVIDAWKGRRVSIADIRNELAAAINWVADRYVNHDDREAYLSFKRLLRADGSKAAAQALGDLLLMVEMFQVEAFFRAARKTLVHDERLRRLLAITEDSMQVRWGLDESMRRLRARNSANARRRRPPFPKEALLRALRDRRTASKQSNLAAALGVSVVTLRKWAAIYGVPLSRRAARKKERSAGSFH